LIDDNKDVLNSLSLLNSRAIKLQNDLESMPSWDNYEPLECLGEGSYGKIFKVREKYGEKRILVIKEIDSRDLKSNYDMLAEINVMARIDSPYIVKYYDSFIQS
jgi:serine/threonine protein kinase